MGVLVSFEEQFFSILNICKTIKNTHVTYICCTFKNNSVYLRKASRLGCYSMLCMRMRKCSE